MTAARLEPPPLRVRTAMEQFPLIRVLSRAITPRLAAFGMTPNQATALGLVSGLAAAACFALGSLPVQLLGAGLFFLYYLFDHCDGELARMCGLASRFGAYFDDLVDWGVHAAFFLAVGYHAMAEAGEALWMWLGVAAALGGTVNAALPLVLGRVPEGEPQVSTLSDLGQDAGVAACRRFCFSRIGAGGFLVDRRRPGAWWVALGAVARRRDRRTGVLAALPQQVGTAYRDLI